jgi:hypothetical protein
LFIFNIYTRHLSLFSAFDPEIALSGFDTRIKKPIMPKANPIIINPPKPKERLDSNSPLVLAMNEYYKLIYLSFKMFPLVLERHIFPMIMECNNKEELLQFTTFLFKEWEHALEMLTRLVQSGIDDRWRRSIPEWIMIVKYALETSPQAASKKYSGVIYDGKKEVRLSPKIIHDRIPEIKTFYETYPRYYALHIFMLSLIKSFIDDDPELLEIYKAYERQYDENEKQQHLQKQQQQKGKRSAYRYEYFVMRHYDSEPRKEHRIKEKDIPLEMVQRLRAKRVNYL